MTHPADLHPVAHSIDSLEAQNGSGQPKRFDQQLSKIPLMMWINGFVVLFFILVALLGPLLAPHDPTEFHWQQSKLPPAWVSYTRSSGETQYLLGTDMDGRDLLSRLLYGTRTTMLLAIVSVPLAALLGTTIGILSGYFSGRTDQLLMRATDIFSAFPSILFSILIMLILWKTPFGKWLNGLGVLTLAFFLIGWVSLARLVRSAVLSIKKELYIEAAHANGLREGRILFRHILPGILGLVMVWSVTAIPRVIILEALLGYIGIGITPDIEQARFVVTSWGGLFLDGRQAIHSNPVRLIAPTLCVMLAVVSFTLLGDELRDLLDPRSNSHTRIQTKNNHLHVKY